MNAPSSATLTVDVAIVGGGVAGSSLAAALAGAGLGVAVVERVARFRDRIRGEALHPWGAAEADRLGLVPVLRAAGGQPLPVWQRYRERAAEEPYRWAEDVPAGHVEWGVSHPALQEALLAHAAGRGARVLRPARVAGFRRGSRPELSVDGDPAVESVRARLVVGADGRASAARRWLGAASHADPVHHSIGGCLLAGVALDGGAAHQAFFPGGMALVFPQGGGRQRGYLVCDPERAAQFRGPTARAAFVAACADAFPEGAFREARAVGPAGFFPSADTWADPIAGDGVVLVGDAAGANDPSQGHGLSLAFRDARALRDRLLGTDPAAWPAATAAFAADRAAAFAVLRAHAIWAGILLVDQGPEADRRRERVARAREADPTAGGFAGIHAFGPAGLVADEAARRHFFGEDLVGTAAA
jgi:2-polyprenyl-6-methoxyphenol hydroxylase-like FAD-dependent oxidoreductase